ncbi:Putative rmlC-like cupin domain superfamily, rmlC-like jelly roll protein [Septoria linicola]|uniref:RmlC-like cupin domain superfamily, rmlC-like jelly roll protein n=1 Tax=Septoria linicola TaxID=215465 RepID=A0A9Q9EN85_9PEZI|nr:putative rmlC-like cupin domain superfamily, rmlC-like jelly roll protein [Septoria linicola]USW56342.1 Putative rmlC-like cupin domain superfamily, rmlC-like jelly roll protein [Septoria linicola]
MFRLQPMDLILLLCLLWLEVAAIDITRNAEQMAKLKMAATQLDRLALLPNSADWTFDFANEKFSYNWAPGGVTNMNAATFPATKGNGLTLAMVNLGPCAMLPPHFHPRAANWVVSVMGNTTTWMQEENGAHTIVTYLPPGKATIFPAGAMHMMANNECEPAQLVSALNSEDAGTLNIGQVFTNGFAAEWVNAAFGGNIVTDTTAERMVPVGTGANWGSAECLARCKIMPRDATGRPIEHGR